MELGYNYIGAIIFWLYILLALVFSGIVLQNLYNLWTTYSSQSQSSSTGETKNQRSGIPRKNTSHTTRNVRIFATLAALSFAVLSFNMLHVLVRSYFEWNGRVTSGLFDNGKNHILYQIGYWSLTSSLFRDFGEAIVADESRYLWVLLALWATFGVCWQMALEGSARNVPRLWAFFCLAQILPISFAQNLFYIACELRPENNLRFVVDANGSRADLGVRVLTFVPLLVLYAACLLVAPTFAGTAKLIPLILFARVLLFIPSVAGAAENGRVVAPQRLLLVATAVVIVSMTLRQVAVAWSAARSAESMLLALFEHPAVSALGCDFILSILSTSVRAWLRTEKYDSIINTGKND